MKTFKALLFVVFFFAVIGCSAQTAKETAVAGSTEKVEAYYFHFSTRCATCLAVESETKADLENLYPQEMKQGLITFQAVNLDDASSKEIAAKLKISGQTLLIVKGDQKINITNEGFLYARTDPEKLKTIVKEKVDPLL